MVCLVPCNEIIPKHPARHFVKFCTTGAERRGTACGSRALLALELGGAPLDEAVDFLVHLDSGKPANRLEPAMAGAISFEPRCVVAMEARASHFDARACELTRA